MACVYMTVIVDASDDAAPVQMDAPGIPRLTAITAGLVTNDFLSVSTSDIAYLLGRDAGLSLQSLTSMG